ncbi:MAG: hypothetical protein Q8P92_01600 [Candidatus Daviesbacteria bacterium]|nr:hypothetical protein [Candidatus Daviesbacteria bacterium]
MSKNINLFIIIILLLGIIFKLFLTANGNFLFNMDNGRDLVDVREMVELKKLRLTGPTSAIEGLFNGPAWYYLLAIPYIFSDGHPYSTIILQFVLWAIGGYFLLKLVSEFNKILIIPIGLLWIASDYISLATVYAFNPNPVTLTSPLLIFLIYKYLKTNKLIYSISSFFLGGLFFNFEMNFGIFVPLIITASILLNKKFHYFRSRIFWLGSLFFILLFLPQILFDIRHDFLMTKSVINYLANQPESSYNISLRLQSLTRSFVDVFSATLMNHRTLSLTIILLFIPALIKFVKGKQKNEIVMICLSFIFIPFIIFLFIPVSVNPWHLGAETSAAIILTGFLLMQLAKFNIWGKLIGILIGSLIIFFAATNVINFFAKDFGKPNMDPSSYRNEIAAIDFVYTFAGGKNFKVYTYLPSVIDYPYQYLFWWYGQKRYGYIPFEYAYHPNVPPYISNKEKFEGSKQNYSGLVFLIKEPDRIKMRRAWEDNFDNLELIKKEMVGPLEVEIRQEII